MGKIRIEPGLEVVVTKPGLKSHGKTGRVVNVRFGLADVEFEDDSGKKKKVKIGLENLKVKDNHWPILPGIAIIFTNDSRQYFSEFRTEKLFGTNGMFCNNAIIIRAKTLEDVEEAVHNMQDDSCKNSDIIKEDSHELYVLFDGVMYDLEEQIKVRFSMKESSI